MKKPFGQAHPDTAAAHRAALQAGARAALRYRLCVPREAMRGAVGTRAGMQSGVSIDFRDYRDYAPGDDVRHIDWNLYARTERLIVKLFREEVTPHLDLLLDGSRSMHLPGTDKAAAALHLTALLAAAAAHAACTCKVWSAGAACVPVPAGAHHAAWRTPPDFESAGSPAPGLAAAAGAFKRHGLRVLVSDLLWDDDPLHVLWPLAENAAALYVVQVLTDGERHPRQTGNLRLHDVESGQTRDLFVDQAALDRYRSGLHAHQTAWRDACRRCGARWIPLPAEGLEQDGALAPLQRHGLIE